MYKQLALAVSTLAVTLNAQAWNEVTDAGPSLVSAQVPCGSGSLATINGVIAPGDRVDIYAVSVPDPTVFVATTCNAASFSDTRLFVFDLNGNALSFNDDDPSGCGLKSRVTGQFLPGPGTYLVAVTGFGNMAKNPSGQELWALTPFNVERQPDGPGAGNPVFGGWAASGFTFTGSYQIDLTGAEYAPSTNPVWNEVGDAGDMPGTRQCPTGCGPLTSIVGATTLSDRVDLYVIDVPNPATFVATTCNAASFTDTRLYLFDLNGNALSFNDDDPTGCLAGSVKSRVTGQFLPGPGKYLLGIAGFAVEPKNAASLSIYALFPFNVERQPDGLGAGNPVLDSWAGSNLFFGPYQIDLTGAAYCGSTQAATCVETGAGCGGLSLACASVPRIGGSLDVTLTGAGPAGVGIGAVLVKLGAPLAGIPQVGPQWAAGCESYLGAAPTVNIGLTATSPAMLSLPLPNNGFVLGLRLGLQGAAIDFAPFLIKASNALDAQVGDC